MAILLLLIAGPAVASLGPEIDVPRAGLRAARGEDVVVASNGSGYAAAWQAPYGNGVRYVPIGAEGAPDGDPIQLTDAGYASAAIAAAGDSFLIAAGGSSFLFHGRTRVATHTLGVNPYRMSLAFDGSEFLLAWSDNHGVVIGEILDRDGAPAGPAFTIASQNAYQVAVASNGGRFFALVAGGSAISAYTVAPDGTVSFGSRVELLKSAFFASRPLTWDGSSYVATFDEYVDGHRTMIQPFTDTGVARDVPTFVAAGEPAAIEAFSGGSVVFINGAAPLFMCLGRFGAPIDQLPQPLPLPLASVAGATCGAGRCYVASEAILRGGVTDLVTPAEAVPFATDRAQQYEERIAAGDMTLFLALYDTGGNETFRVHRYRDGAWLTPATELPDVYDVALAAAGDRAAILINNGAQVVQLRYMNADGVLSDVETLDTPVLSPKSSVQLLGATRLGNDFLLTWLVASEHSSPGTVNPPYTYTYRYAIATPGGGISGPFDLPQFTVTASSGRGAVAAAYDSGGIVFGRFGERLTLRVTATALDGLPLAIASNGTRSLVTWNAPDGGHIAIVDEASMTLIATKPSVRWFEPDAVWTGREFIVGDGTSLWRFDANGNLIGNALAIDGRPKLASGPAGTAVAYEVQRAVANYDLIVVLRAVAEVPRRRPSGVTTRAPRSKACCRPDL